MSEYRVGVRDLKARLSEYLRQVKQGHTVVITEHGKPLGRIVPVDAPIDQRTTRLIEAKLLAWNGNKLTSLDPPATNRSEQLVSDLLVELRE